MSQNTEHIRQDAGKNTTVHDPEGRKVSGPFLRDLDFDELFGKLYSCTAGRDIPSYGELHAVVRAQLSTKSLTGLPQRFFDQYGSFPELEPGVTRVNWIVLKSMTPELAQQAAREMEDILSCLIAEYRERNQKVNM